VGRTVTGQGVLAQPGLKATLQAFGPEVLNPTKSLQGDLRTSVQCSSLWQDFIAVAQLLSFYKSCRMRLHQSTFASFFNASSTILQWWEVRSAVL